MVRNDRSVALATSEVSYDRALQFRGEFKCMFGLSPAQEVRRMRSGFTLLSQATQFSFFRTDTALGISLC